MWDPSLLQAQPYCHRTCLVSWKNRWAVILLLTTCERRDKEGRSLYCSSLQLLYSLNILIGKILPGSFSNNIMHKRVKSPMWIFHYQELWEGTSIVIFSLKSFKFRFWLSKMAVVGENPTHESSNSESSFNFGLGSEIPSPLALANCGKLKSIFKYLWPTFKLTLKVFSM